MDTTEQLSFWASLIAQFGEGNGTPLQYSCLENPMGRGAWSAAVHGVAKSQTQLSDFTFTFHFHALEKEMATHSSVLAWRSPGMGEPGGLPSMGSHRVGHNWSDLAAADSSVGKEATYLLQKKMKQVHTPKISHYLCVPSSCILVEFFYMYTQFHQSDTWINGFFIQ